MGYEKRIRVLLADCHYQMREGMATLLSEELNMHVQSNATNPDEAIATLFREHQPTSIRWIYR